MREKFGYSGLNIGKNKKQFNSETNPLSTDKALTENEIKYEKLISRNVRFLDSTCCIAKGKLLRYKDYQKVKINMYLLEKALNYFKGKGYDSLYIFVRDDYPIQISNKKDGIIIAPILDIGSKK